MNKTLADILPIHPSECAISAVEQASDERLLARYARTSDPVFFAELARRYEGELHGYLRRFLGDAELAKDVLQLTLLQLHLKCDTFTEGRRFRPWLYAIATNQAIDATRAQRRHKAASIDCPVTTDSSRTGTLAERLIASEQGPESRSQRREQREGVRRAVNRLPANLRRLVQLIYFDGLKYREAAETLAIPEGTVKSRMHAAFSKLQQGLTQMAS